MTDGGKRILISTQSFPPMTGGTPVILYELLRHLPREAFIAVHGTSDPFSMAGEDLGIERKMVLFAGSPKWTLRLRRRWPGLYTRMIRPQIERLAKEHKVQRIYAHFPSPCFMIAAWQVAEKLNLPLTVYFDILWEESDRAAGAPLARKYEKRIVQRADSRFAITEFAAEHLSRKHDVPFELIPHTIDVGNLPTGLRPLPAGAEPVVHFSGGIYPRMNQDAIARLVEAAGLSRHRPSLDLCTPCLPRGLDRQRLKTRYLSRDGLMAAQSQSDILYLPQAFESGRPVMIRHNFPTKTMEYLRSGRPILVHSPADSYLTWLARREGFALVVDRPDVRELADAVDRLIEDQELQGRLVERALGFVKTRDGRIWAQKLWSALTDNPR